MKRNLILILGIIVFGTQVFAADPGLDPNELFSACDINRSHLIKDFKRITKELHRHSQKTLSHGRSLANFLSSIQLRRYIGNDGLDFNDYYNILRPSLSQARSKLGTPGKLAPLGLGGTINSTTNTYVSYNKRFISRHPIRRNIVVNYQETFHFQNRRNRGPDYTFKFSSKGTQGLDIKGIQNPRKKKYQTCTYRFKEEGQLNHGLGVTSVTQGPSGIDQLKCGWFEFGSLDVSSINRVAIGAYARYDQSAKRFYDENDKPISQFEARRRRADWNRWRKSGNPIYLLKSASLLKAYQKIAVEKAYQKAQAACAKSRAKYNSQKPRTKKVENR